MLIKNYKIELEQEGYGEFQDSDEDDYFDDDNYIEEVDFLDLTVKDNVPIYDMILKDLSQKITVF